MREARVTQGREAWKDGPSPKETAGVRNKQREPEESRTATHTTTFRKFLQKRLLREAVGFLELLLEERIP